MVTQVLFIIVMLVICFGTILHHRFLRLMRVRHPSIWRSVGQPSVFSVGGSLIMSIPLLRFLWRKEYLSLDDQEFARLAGFAARLMFSSCASLLRMWCSASAASNPRLNANHLTH